MSNSGKSDSAKVALAYIESLTARFENAERHINDDIEAIEKRLTQLVEQLQRCHEMLKDKWGSIAADSGSDAGLNDLAGQMSAKHAKMAWKFRSTGGQQ